MYWEARMRIHQQKQTLAVLFITNHIADVLSDLSWTAVLAHAEPCVENRTVRFFFLWTVPPLIYIYRLHLRKEVPYKVIILIRDLDMEEFENPWIEETIIYVLDCMQVETKNVLH